jgi:hypothetical protein
MTTAFAPVDRTEWVSSALHSRLVALPLSSLFFLYLHLFIPPCKPIWTGGDALIWLHHAGRMLGGEVLYRDIFEITLPGTDFLYFAAFKVFGKRIWIPNVMLILVGTTLAWLTYRIGRSVHLGKLAVLPPLVFLTVVFRERLDATHHWYSTLATMAAMAAAIEQRSSCRLIIAGAFCGLASCFTQSAGCAALLAFAIFLCWEHRRTSTTIRSLVSLELLLMASFTTVVLIGSCYFAAQAGMGRFLYSTILFNLRYYSSFEVGSSWRGYMIGLPAFLQWRHIPGLLGFLLIHGLLPLVYILVFLRYGRRIRRTAIDHECWSRLMLVAVVGSALLLSVAGAPTWSRLNYVSLPALILFVWLLKSWGHVGRRLSSGLFCFTGLLAIAQPIAVQVHSRDYLNLPVGVAAFLDRNAYDRYQWVGSQSLPGDFFFGGLFPDCYFTLDLRNAAAVPFVSPYEYTRPEQVTEVIAGLEKHRVRLALWSPALDLPEDHHGDHLGPLRAYLRNHYHVAKEFPDFEVWVRDGPP